MLSLFVWSGLAVGIENHFLPSVHTYAAGTRCCLLCSHEMACFSSPFHQRSALSPSIYRSLAPYQTCALTRASIFFPSPGGAVSRQTLLPPVRHLHHFPTYNLQHTTRLTSQHVSTVASDQDEAHHSHLHRPSCTCRGNAQQSQRRYACRRGLYQRCQFLVCTCLCPDLILNNLLSLRLDNALTIYYQLSL